MSIEIESDIRFDSAAKGICGGIEKYLRALPGGIKEKVQEIRLRVNRPVSVCCAGSVYFLNADGRITCCPGPQNVIARRNDLDESFRNICGYSIYSHENEIKNGYITICGGHRVGIGGTAVLHDGRVSGMKDISSVNIRIAREIIGCADKLLDEIKGAMPCGLLVAGAPSSGKTTILRDIARQLSCGKRGSVKKVTVVDERGEIAGTYLGVPQNDLGFCCDVLDGYPKAEGILQAVRSLSPEFIICDELGTDAETAAVEQGLNAGAVIIASIHAGSIEELLKRKQAVALLETGAFARVAMLGGCKPGEITKIYKAGDLLAKAAGRADSYNGGNARGVYGIA